VYLLTDEDGEFLQLKLKDPVTHQSRSVTPASAWDVEDFDVSSDGRYLAYVVDDDGRSRLTVLDTQAKLELAAPGLPEGRIGNLRFDRTGRRLAMSAESALAPRMSTSTTSSTASSSAGPAASRAPSIQARSRRPSWSHYPTWDHVGRRARMLSAYVYRPRTAAGPCPVVIDIHGGLSRSTARAGIRSRSFSSTSSATPCRAQRARLIRLWQDLPRPRQRRAARGRGA